MRRASLTRYTLCGAIGFGAGTALSDLGGYYLQAPLWNMFGQGSVYLYYVFLSFVGTLGGASLGVALGDWKKAVLLAVVGSVGFGIGLGFLGEMVLYMTYLYSLGGLLGGAIGGAALGLALRGIKGAVSLGWAGAIGFGLGGGVSDLLMLFGGAIPESMILSSLAGGMALVWVTEVLQGVVGGAVVGAALALSKRREPRPARVPRVA